MRSPAPQTYGRGVARRSRGSLSRSCSPAQPPGSPLRAEFNASLSNSSDRSLKSTTSPRRTRTPSPIRQEEELGGEPLWMGRVMEMLSETTMSFVSGTANPPHSASRAECGGLSTIVGPALPRLPSIESGSATPTAAPQLLPTRTGDARGESKPVPSTGLPIFTTNQNAAQKRGVGTTKIVLEERTIRAMCGPGHSGDFVDTAPVPACAKNKALRMDTRLLAVGDWRGPQAASRGSSVYKIANAVIAAAYRMAMREQGAKTERLDRCTCHRKGISDPHLSLADFQNKDFCPVLSEDCKRYIKTYLLRHEHRSACSLPG